MIITTFNRVQQAYVKATIELTWAETREFLQSAQPAVTKESVELFNLNQFRSLSDPEVEPGRRYHYSAGVRQDTFDIIPNTVRRSRSNLIASSGLVLDIDRKLTIIEAIDRYQEYEFVLYSTFNNLKDGVTEKFRIVIPYSQPLLAADLDERVDGMEQLFPDVDRASFSITQCFYFHSGSEQITHYNSGRFIDPYQDFVHTPSPVWEPRQDSTPMSSSASLQYRARVLTALRTCRDVHFDSALTLAALCKNIGLSASEFSELVDQISAVDSSLRQDNKKSQAWSAAEDRCRSDTRDAFIRRHHGQPIPVSEYRAFNEKMKSIIEKYRV